MWKLSFMYVHVARPAVPAAWEGMCPCVPKGAGGSWHRGGAVRMWKVGGSEATSVEGTYLWDQGEQTLH